MADEHRADPNTAEQRVTFRELTREECDTLLSRQRVGRIAYAYQNRVDIVPIHYVYRDGWIYGRSAFGKKLAILRHAPWVAFEIDQVEDVFDWQSVVVHGSFQILDPERSARERGATVDAVQLLRELLPDALTPHDPTPERNMVFRIHADEVTGRAASTRE